MMPWLQRNVVRRAEGLAWFLLVPLLALAWLAALAVATGPADPPRAAQLKVTLRRWRRFVGRGFSPFRDTWWEAASGEPYWVALRYLLMLEFLAWWNMFRPAAPAAFPDFLVVQLHHMGNILMSYPLLRHLRARWPAARRDALAGPWGAELLARSGSFDAVWVYNPPIRMLRRAVTRDARGFFAELRFLLGLRARGYHTLLGLGVPHFINLVVQQALCPRRWLGAARAQDLYCECGETCATPHHSRLDEARRLLDYLPLLGAPAVADRPEFAIHAAEAAVADELFLRHGLAAAARVVALAPGAGVPAKRWPAERFAELADRLAAATNAAVVLVGSAAERELTHRVAAALRRARCVDLAGATTTGELAAVLHKCALFIGNDSGPLHLAAAVGRPTVGLFGPAQPEGWAPKGPQHIALRQDAGCAACDAWSPGTACAADARCMRLIGVDDVLAAALRLLPAGAAEKEGHGAD